MEEFTVVEFGDNPRDDLADGAPRAAQQSSGGGRGHLDGAPGCELFERVSVTSTMARPRNGRDHDPVFGALDSRDSRDDEDFGSSKVECSPTTLTTRVIAGATTLAVRASPSVLNAGSHVNLDGVVDEVHIFHAHALGVDAQAPRQ